MKVSFDSRVNGQAKRSKGCSSIENPLNVEIKLLL